MDALACFRLAGRPMYAASAELRVRRGAAAPGVTSCHPASAST
jgi:hypothetical protein